MALPEISRESAQRVLSTYCEQKIPMEFRDRLKLAFTFRGHSVTLFEERPAFRKPETWVQHKVAQFRMDKETFEWSLFWADRNGRWLPHTEFGPTRSFEHALAEVERNPNGMFWG